MTSLAPHRIMSIKECVGKRGKKKSNIEMLAQLTHPQLQFFFYGINISSSELKGNYIGNLCLNIITDIVELSRKHSVCCYIFHSFTQFFFCCLKMNVEKIECREFKMLRGEKL
jgi:hypothetical protein